MIPALADVVGIEIEHVDFAADYRERVFAELHREFRAGRTPNPDVLCCAEIGLPNVQKEHSTGIRFVGERPFRRMADRKQALQAAGGAKGGDTQACRRQTVARNSHAHRPRGPASHCPSAHADFRSDVLRFELRFRPVRNAHHAIRQAHATAKAGHHISVELELARSLDTVKLEPRD